MYLKVKSKKLKNLSIKIAQVKNNLVVNILNKKGYECDNSQISQIKANRKYKNESEIEYPYASSNNTKRHNKNRM